MKEITVNKNTFYKASELKPHIDNLNVALKAAFPRDNMKIDCSVFEDFEDGYKPKEDLVFANAIRKLKDYDGNSTMSFKNYWSEDTEFNKVAKWLRSKGISVGFADYCGSGLIITRLNFKKVVELF